MAEGYAADPGATLAGRLVDALERGAAAGGQADTDGHHKPELSAFVRVFNSAVDPFVYGDGRSAVLDLRVDYDADAIGPLRRLFEDCRLLRAAYEQRMRDPEAYARRAASWEMDLHEGRAPAR
ncbi:MAG: DUF1028 domain-containing protein [Alphaproteobacteria bacterium]|nr:DUF1028 domain-containing protein [Alphaproteobacteria bacterium]